MIELCFPVWISAAASHLSHVDRVASKAVKPGDGLIDCDLKHRSCVAACSMFYKIH